MTSLFSSGGVLRQLYPHQEHAIDMLRASLRAGHKRPLIQGACGFGKTLLSAHIIQLALDKGKKVIFTVPVLSLIDQTVEAFAREGIHAVGVVQGCHPATDHTQPVQVCSVQTLARRQTPAADLVLIDEAHLMFKSVLQWMTDPAWAAVPFIGLSATPWARGLGRYFDDLIVAARTGELIDAGFLSPLVVYAPSEPDLSGVRTVAGDYHQGELSDACNKTELVGDVISTWMQRGEDRQTLCYGVDRAHAEHLQQRFIEAGVAAAYVDCYTERAERERIFERFRSGEVRVICNCATLTTGVDLPMTGCLIDAKPTRSEMLFVQTIGRGLRTAPGKDNLIVLDHAGNHLRLGLVTDIHHDHLDDGEQRKGRERAEKRTPLPRLCQDCKAVLPPLLNVCPQCGHAREAPSNVQARDGELVPLGSGKSGRRDPSIDEKSAFFSELKQIAAERNYSSGWAAHKFRERYKVWPNDPRIRFAEPRPPSLKTRNWVRSRQIAYAKARRAG